MLTVRLLQWLSTSAGLQLVERRDDGRAVYSRMQGDWTAPRGPQQRDSKLAPYMKLMIPGLTISALAGQVGLAVSNSRPCRAVRSAVGTPVSDVVAGLVNPACTGQKSVSIPQSQRDIWGVGKRPLLRLFKGSVNGSTRRVSIVAVQSARQRVSYCRV